jgi:hypothetical protein
LYALEMDAEHDQRGAEDDKHNGYLGPILNKNC